MPSPAELLTIDSGRATRYGVPDASANATTRLPSSVGHDGSAERWIED
jgi:hypothetical protein